MALHCILCIYSLLFGYESHDQEGTLSLYCYTWNVVFFWWKMHEIHCLWPSINGWENMNPRNHWVQRALMMGSELPVPGDHQREVGSYWVALLLTAGQSSSSLGWFGSTENYIQRMLQDNSDSLELGWTSFLIPFWDCPWLSACKSWRSPTARKQKEFALPSISHLCFTTGLFPHETPAGITKNTLWETCH